MIFKDRGAVGWCVVSGQDELPFKQVRIRDESLVWAVLEHLRSNECVTLLGAPFSEKTELLLDVASALQGTGFSRPIYIDLQQTESSSEVAFLTNFASLMMKALGDLDNIMEDEIPNPRAFSDFLLACKALVNCQLVLLIDHLQAMPHYLIHGLLLALRAAYMEQRPDAPHRFVAVVAGGTKLMGLSTASTSPFNMAKVVVVEPLSHEQTLALAAATFQKLSFEASTGAVDAVVEWTEGDRYLVPWLCGESAKSAQGYRKPRITAATVNSVAERLLVSATPPPLQAALQTIEEDPDTLLDVLRIMDQGGLPQALSRRPLTRTATGRLQLSGAVALVGGAYRIKNRALRQVLTWHLTPDRVTHVLRTAGRWHAAIDFLALKSSSDGQERIRPLLLETIIRSIYVTDSLQEAFQSLARGLVAGFGLAEIGIYRASQIHNRLERINSADGIDVPSGITSIDLGNLTTPEARAFHYGNYALVGTASQARLIVPLLAHHRAIGLVTIEVQGQRLSRSQSPDELNDVLSFLWQAADAISSAITRQAYHKAVQATLNGDLEQMLKVVSDALGANSLSAYLLNPAVTSLEIATYMNPERNNEHPVHIALNETSRSPAAECLREQRMIVVKRPRRLGAENDESRSPDITSVFYPLHARQRQIGIIHLDFLGGFRVAFSSPMMQDLVVFADQIAVALIAGKLVPQPRESALGIPRPSPSAIRRSHLEQQLAELNENYNAWTRRIAAVDKDIGRAVTNEQKLLAQDQKRDLEIEREQFVTKMIKIEEELAQS